MEKYIVQEGDNIITIARQFGVKIMDIINANNLVDATYLIPGTELIIPNKEEENFTYHIVKKGDNLYQIAKMHDISVDDLALINGLKKDEFIHENQRIMVPNKNIGVYVTKEDDTLNSVSSNLNIDKEKLLEMNEKIFLLPDQMIVYRKTDV